MTQATRTMCQTSDINAMLSPYPAATTIAPIIRVTLGPFALVRAADTADTAIITSPCGARIRPTASMDLPSP